MAALPVDEIPLDKIINERTSWDQVLWWIPSRDLYRWDNRTIYMLAVGNILASGQPTPPPTPPPFSFEQFEYLDTRFLLIQDLPDVLKGADGADGADGASAYDLWIDAGNTGTVQQFLDSMKGQKGDPGTPGAPGTPGYQPPTGQAIATVDATTKDFVDGGILDSLRKSFGTIFRSPGSTVDMKSALLAVIASGETTINMHPRDTYYMYEPIFLDSPDPRQTITINWNNARLNLGAGGGAKSTEMSALSDVDTEHRFYVFANTKASAYNSTTRVVTTGESTTATGDYTATVGPRIVMNDLDVRGGNQCVSLVHLSNTSGRFPTGRVTNMMGVVGTRSYCDSNWVGVRNTNPYTGSEVEIASTILQRGNGDNLMIIGNADTRARIADLRYCRGATILAPVGGSLRFVDCFGINVIGGHLEGDEHYRNSPVVVVTRSQVRITGTEIWSANSVRENGLPIIQTIEVNDGSSNPDAFTELTLEGVISRGVYRIAPSGGSIVDEQQVPDLTIKAMNLNSMVRARGYMAATSISNTQEVNRIAPLISSSVPAIQSALDAGAGIIATGFWDLLRVNDAWKVVAAANPDLVTTVARTAAPDAGTPLRNTIIPGAVPGNTYNYYFAEMDESGGLSKRTVSKQVVQSSALASVRLDVTLRRPGRIVVWRQVNGQPIDRCAIFGTDATKLFLYDTGANISKRPWLMSGYPERPADVNVTTSVDSLKFNGKSITLT